MRLALTAVLLLNSAIACFAAPVATDNQRVYIFGNSLIHHLTKSDETTVPHWLAQLAAADGTKFAANGQWGFLRDFVKQFPPTDQWSFKKVPRAWNRNAGPFEKADLTAILVNPANFIQYQGVDKPYDGDNRDKESPLGATLKLFDKVAASHKQATFYIYEGWSNGEQYAKSYPFTRPELDKYLAFNAGAYHDWYVDYRNRVAESRPDLNVQLIPVATVLSKLYANPPLNALRPEELYQDLDPHGTATTYFLAAVITYTALYGRPVPANFDVPASLPPLVKSSYPDIRRTVCTELLAPDQC